jgi:hypothetical protein
VVAAGGKWGVCGVPLGCGAQIDCRRCGVKIVWHIDESTLKKYDRLILAVHKTHACVVRLSIACGPLASEPPSSLLSLLLRINILAKRIQQHRVSNLKSQKLQQNPEENPTPYKRKAPEAKGGIFLVKKAAVSPLPWSYKGEGGRGERGLRAWSRSRRGWTQGGGAMAGAARTAWLLVVLCCCCSWTQRQILVSATTDANDGGEPESCPVFFRLPSLLLFTLRLSVVVRVLCINAHGFIPLGLRSALSGRVGSMHRHLFFPVPLYWRCFCSYDLNPVPLGVQKQGFL